MRTLRNPQGVNESREDRPNNPFTIYISWKSKNAEWIVKPKGQEKRPLKAPIDFLVLDILFTIKGGDMKTGNEVFSRPHYRETSQIVKVWNKTIHGVSSPVEGAVAEIYPRLQKEFDASKACQVFGLIVATGELAVLDLTGYAISPFLDLGQDLAENPVITLNLEGQPVTMDAAKLKAWGQLHNPIFTTSPNFTPELAEQAQGLINDPEISAYLDYLEGKTAPEEKESKNFPEPY